MELEAQDDADLESPLRAEGRESNAAPGTGAQPGKVSRQTAARGMPGVGKKFPALTERSQDKDVEEEELGGYDFNFESSDDENKEEGGTKEEEEIDVASRSKFAAKKKAAALRKQTW